MSEIYLGKDERTHKLVLLKTMPEQIEKNETKDNIRKILLNEANILSNLNHDGIVKFYDSLYFRGDCAIVMEYINGCNMRALRKLIKIGQKDVVYYSIQILNILKYLHNCGIVYSDLKPENIMVGKGKKIRLVDFGLSCYSGQKYAPGLFYGTAGYAPCEQYNGEVDCRTDIYSLGRTMIFMFTNINPEPFEQMNYSIKANICLLFLIDKAISENPDDRFQNSDEMLDELIKIEKKINENDE